MRKSFFTVLALASTLILNYTHAQTNELVSTIRNDENSPLRHDEYSGNVVVDRAFSKHFRLAKKLSWRETNTELIARFMIRDELVIAWFTKNGQLSCTNYYGTGIYLPASEKRMIREKYPEYTIKAYLKIVKDQVTAFVVTIHSCERLVKVKMINGETEEMENLILAK